MSFTARLPPGTKDTYRAPTIDHCAGASDEVSVETGMQPTVSLPRLRCERRLVTMRKETYVVPVTGAIAAISEAWLSRA